MCQLRLFVRVRFQQGLTALVLGYNPEGTLEDNAEAMTAALGDVKSGAVTTSVRDTTLNGLRFMLVTQLVCLTVKSSFQYQMLTSIKLRLNAGQDD